MCPAEQSLKFSFQDSTVGKEIIQTFVSLDLFKEKFAASALARFGSGWAWLVINEDNKLEIIDTANQDSPLSLGKTPILALDVWEHAYYLKYQNRRKDYVTSWWNVVNWQEVENRFTETA
jgi:Fe-Mn family superoxide dismutase